MSQTLPQLESWTEKEKKGRLRKPAGLSLFVSWLKTQCDLMLLPSPPYILYSLKPYAKIHLSFSRCLCGHFITAVRKELRQLGCLTLPWGELCESVEMTKVCKHMELFMTKLNTPIPLMPHKKILLTSPGLCL